ncbi:MAG: hypothetical protein V3V97_21740 [Hyphomicrobiaceae bacterium]
MRAFGIFGPPCALAATLVVVACGVQPQKKMGPPPCAPNSFYNDGSYGYKYRTDCPKEYARLWQEAYRWGELTYPIVVDRRQTSDIADELERTAATDGLSEEQRQRLNSQVSRLRVREGQMLEKQRRMEKAAADAIGQIAKEVGWPPEPKKNGEKEGDGEKKKAEATS